MATPSRVPRPASKMTGPCLFRVPTVPWKALESWSLSLPPSAPSLTTVWEIFAANSGLVTHLLIYENISGIFFYVHLLSFLFWKVMLYVCSVLLWALAVSGDYRFFFFGFSTSVFKIFFPHLLRLFMGSSWLYLYHFILASCSGQYLFVGLVCFLLLLIIHLLEQFAGLFQKPILVFRSI